MTSSVALALDSSGRRESRAGAFGFDELRLDRFGAGSGVLLLGTSSSSMISLLLGLLDIFAEMLASINKH
jgi:hypothetical protein